MKAKELVKKYWIVPCLIVIVLAFVVKASFFGKNDNWIDKGKLFKGFEEYSENRFRICPLVTAYIVNSKGEAAKHITIFFSPSGANKDDNLDLLALDKFFKRLFPDWDGARETLGGRIPMLMEKAKWISTIYIPYNEYHIGVLHLGNMDTMITIEKNRKMAR